MNEAAVRIMLLGFRQALLGMVDAIEIYLCMKRTAEARRESRELEYRLQN